MIAVLFGPPGSGKGTQAAFITRDFVLTHVSTGDMLRAEAGTGSALGNQVAPLMEAGRLVPDDLIVRVIDERLRRGDVQHGVVFDGFPRTVGQAAALDAMLAASNRHVDLVISLVVPAGEIVERLLGRALDQRRADDTAEAVRARMVEHEVKAAPVLEHYRSREITVASVDGVGSVEAVRGRIHRELSSVLDDGGTQLHGRVERTADRPGGPAPAPRRP
jgi:adenylate kinase